MHELKIHKRWKDSDKSGGEVGKREVEVLKKLILRSGVVVEISDGTDSHGFGVVQRGSPGNACGFHIFDSDVVLLEEIKFVFEGVEGIAGGDGGGGEVDVGWRVELLWAVCVVGELGQGNSSIVVVGFFDEKSLPDRCGLRTTAGGTCDENEPWFEAVDEELSCEGRGGGANEIGIGAWVVAIGDKRERMIIVRPKIWRQVRFPRRWGWSEIKSADDRVGFGLHGAKNSDWVRHG